MARPKTIPSYRFHKASGQAVVTIAGLDQYLGPHGSAESRNVYDRLIAEWLAGGRRPPVRQVEAAPLTIIELIDGYLAHVEKHFPNRDHPGRPSKEYNHSVTAAGPVRRLYGTTPAAAFGPLALKAIQVEYIKLGWSRLYINNQVDRIGRMFRWAVGNEMVPPAVLQGMEAVPGLRRGKSEAREGRKVRPVADAAVDAIQDHVSRQVWAMVELMRITGMRAGEVLIMTTGDIDTTGELWEYKPSRHKTENHGHERVIVLGPQGKKIVKPFLRPNLQEYIFSPVDAERERLEAQRAARVAAYRAKHLMARGDGIQPSQKDRSKAKPKHKPHDKYDVCSLRRAIQRACDLAFRLPAELTTIPKDETDEQRTARLAQIDEWRKAHRWHPHQLRHTAATRLRKQYGLEVARIVLGHHSPAVTELYAEADRKRALQVAAEVG